MVYCMAMLLKVLRMDGRGSLNLSSSRFIDGMCVAASACCDDNEWVNFPT